MFGVPKANPGAVTPGGAPVTLSVDVPGAIAAATFEASAGQLFSIQTYDNSDGYYLRVEAAPGTGPSVVVLSNRWILSGESFVDTFTVERAGRYSLIVDPDQDSRVQTTLSLFSLPKIETRPVAFGSPQDILTSLPGENATFSFAGTRDQIVALRLARVQSGSYIYIKRAFSDQKIETQWAPSPSGTLLVLTLPATDEYIITVDPDQSALESATFTLFDVSLRPAAAAQIDGAPARVMTDFPGQQAVLQFQSAGGELVTIRSRERDDAYITVTAPSGAEVVKQQYLAGNGEYQLRDALLAGQYTVVLSPSGFDPAIFTLEVASR
jgi:hypothetical protein